MYIAIAYIRVTTQAISFSVLIAAFQFLCEMSTAEEDDGKDRLKVEFTLAALRRTDDPFSSTVVLHADIIAAIEWQAARSADEVMQAREKVVCEIEALGARLWANGTVAGWYRGCDGAIARVSATVNGPLLEMLCAAARHGDPACIEFFRIGAPLMGLLDEAGIGEPQRCAAVCELEGDCLEHNHALLKMLREDPLGDELIKLTDADVQCGRMTKLHCV